MTITLIAGVTILLSLLMMLGWAVQRRLGNAGWVDVVWSFALGLAGVIYALMPAPDIAWPGPRQILVAGLVAVWSLRLHAATPIAPTRRTRGRSCRCRSGGNREAGCGRCRGR